MAKENEKKVAGDINDDELENVAGGWCMSGGQSKPQKVTSAINKDIGGGNRQLITILDNGDEIHTVIGSDGNVMGSEIVRNK